MSAARDVKIFEYEVTGSTRFPLDMLRYDRAWPATSVDATAAANHRPYEKRTVKLRGLNNPAVGRWASFGWRVTHE